MDRQTYLNDKKFPLQLTFKISFMKPLGVQRMLNVYKYMSSRPEIVKNGFHKCGIKND